MGCVVLLTFDKRLHVDRRESALHYGHSVEQSGPKNGRWHKPPAPPRVQSPCSPVVFFKVAGIAGGVSLEPSRLSNG